MVLSFQNQKHSVYISVVFQIKNTVCTFPSVAQAT